MIDVVKKFFKDAFEDMKQDAKAQHEVDKANFQATKAQSRANWEKAKATGSISKHKEIKQAQRDEQLRSAHEKINQANAEIDKLK